MVHRTDIAGGDAGLTSPGNDRVCRRTRNGALLQNNSSLTRQAMLQSPDGGIARRSCHPFRIHGLGRL